MFFAKFDLNKFRFDYTPDEFINVDNDIQTNEDNFETINSVTTH